VNTNTQNEHKTEAVLFALNFIENDYTSMASFGMCKFSIIVSCAQTHKVYNIYRPNGRNL
jgi:hypothetical protein